MTPPTAGTAMRVALGALVALGAPACYDTPKPECAFLCGPAGSCPDGYGCADDGWCKRDDVSPALVCDPDVNLIDAPVAADAPGPDADVDAPGPDAEVPDADVPDAEVPDADVPDAEVPDAEVPDAEVPDAVVPPDAAIPDAMVPPDTAVPDA